MYVCVYIYIYIHTHIAIHLVRGLPQLRRLAREAEEGVSAEVHAEDRVDGGLLYLRVFRLCRLIIAMT